jgi:hypothetical protein
MQNRVATHIITQARLQTEHMHQLVIAPSTAPWVSLVVLGIFWGGLGSLLLITAREVWFLGAMLLGLALFFVTTQPISIQAIIDRSRGELSVEARYLLRPPAHQTQPVSLAHIARLDYRPAKFLQTGHVVEIGTTTGWRLILNFQRQHGEEAQRVHQTLQAWVLETSAHMAGLVDPAGASEPSLASPEAVHRFETTTTYSTMLASVRSWGVWQLVLGGLQMLQDQAISPWGIVLLLVGGLSFYFRSAAMFVIYAVTIGWAGLSNLLYGEGLWKGFALLQGWWTIQIFQEFFRYRRAQAALEDMPGASPMSDRARPIFPWAGLGLGLAAFGGVLLVLMLIFVWPLVTNDPMPEIFGWGLTGVVFTGILGFGLGLSSILSSYTPKLVAWLGAVLGLLTLLLQLGLILIGTLLE